MDASELYHMSRGQQLELIDQVTDKVLSNQDMGELARLVEQAHLTEEQSHGKVDTDNTDNTEMYRLKDDPRSVYKFIGQQRFDNLTIAAKKNGAIILEIEQYLDCLEASASILGDVVFSEKMSVYPKFWRNVTIHTK